MASAEQVVLYAEFTAKLGRAPEVEELIGGYAERVRAEPGNLAFDVYRRSEAPNKFVVFEIYRDRAAFDAHLDARDGAEFNVALVELIVEDGSKLSFLRPTTH
jgi:quinol monooxygenase YgiN